MRVSAVLLLAAIATCVTACHASECKLERTDGHDHAEVVRKAANQLRKQLSAEASVVEHPIQGSVKVWNAAVKAQPALLVRCASTADVQAAVKVGRRAGLPISVRGGGHDWFGRALADDGLVIDMRRMNAVDIQLNTLCKKGSKAGREYAVVKGAATAGQLLKEALLYNLSAVTGSSGTISVAGLTLGGGYGALNGRFGLAVDNLLAAEVVLADGRAVWASEQAESELFWALRGAGGNFGVVTQLHVRLHPVPRVMTGMLGFPWEQARSVLKGLRRIVATAEDALDLSYGALASPEGRVLFITPTWSGPRKQADQAIDRVRALGTVMIDQVAWIPLADSLQAVEAAFPAGRRYYLGSRTHAELSDPVMDALLSAGTAMPVGCALNVHHVHGQATRVAPTAMAFAEREEHITIEVLGAWDAGDGSGVRAWVRGSLAALDPYALPGGWVAFMAPRDKRVKDAYAVNAERIRAAKERYDPDDVFNATPLPGSNYVSSNMSLIT